MISVVDYCRCDGARGYWTHQAPGATARQGQPQPVVMSEAVHREGAEQDHDAGALERAHLAAAADIRVHELLPPPEDGPGARGPGGQVRI